MGATTNKIEQFILEWEEELKEVSHILRYLHTYPDILMQLDIEDLITAEDLYQRQAEWISLYSQYEGEELDFFRPYWIPIQKNTYSVFLDISQKKYPVFEFHYTSVKPYYYYSISMFESITDFMLIQDKEGYVDELKDKILQEQINQVDISYNKNDELFYSGEEIIEPPDYSDVRVKDKKLFIELKGHKLICKNVKPITIGLLPFDLKFNIKTISLSSKDLPIEKLTSINFLIHYFRSIGSNNIHEYEINIPLADIDASYKNNQLEISSSNEKYLKDFSNALNKLAPK